jgi:hypothetical protein
LGIDESQHILVKETQGEKEAWDKLKEYHVQTTLTARIRILKRLFQIQLEKGQSTRDLQIVFEKFSELNEIGHGLDNGMSVSIVLASLNQEYDSLIIALEA